MTQAIRDDKNTRSSAIGTHMMKKMMYHAREQGQLSRQTQTL